MTALLRQTNYRAAIVQRGLDAALTYQEIADRDGVSCPRPRLQHVGASTRWRDTEDHARCLLLQGVCRIHMGLSDVT
jgi:hypothetical protein